METAVDRDQMVRVLARRKEGLSREHIWMKEFKPVMSGEDGENDTHLMMGETEVELTGDAFDEFLKMVGIPKAFYRKCDPDIKFELLERFIARQAPDWKLHPMMYMDTHQRIIGWSPEDRPLVHIHDIFLRVEGVIDEYTKKGHDFHLIGGKSEYAQDTGIDEHTGTFAWITESETIEARVGDVTHGGLRVHSGDWLENPPSMSYFGYRLICDNGSQVPFNREFMIEGATAEHVLGQITQGAKDILDNLHSKLLKPIKDSVQHVVEDPVQMAHSLSRDRSLNKRIRERFLENVTEMVDNNPGPFTFYDVIQCLTAVQNEDNIGWRDRMWIQELGGSEIVSHEERCDKCQHLLEN